MPTRRIPFPDPLDLRRTVAALGMKASGQSRAGAAEAWWVSRTPDGSATLHLEPRPAAGELVATAWGEGAQWALAAVPELVGAHDRPEDFAPPPGLIRDLHRLRRGLRLGRTGRVFEALLPTILGQKVTNREARLSGIRLVRRYGEPAPGPTDLWLQPAPEHLAALSYFDLHPLGIEGKRASIIVEAARRAKRLEEILGMDRGAAYRRLLGVRGIGEWTAGHVMGIAWGDPDAVPVGDFHLPNAVAYALAGQARGDDARMLQLLEPYSGHRRRVVMLLKSAGIKAPKFGPRSAARAIERI